MANQADREGVQRLIEKWRERASESRHEAGRPVYGVTHRGVLLDAANVLSTCADELAALQGSVASPQEYERPHDGSMRDELRCTAVGSTVPLGPENCELQRIKSAGLGATTPAPQQEK